MLQQPNWLPDALHPIARILLISHRPLAFMIGQSMLLAVPLAELAGWQSWLCWAERLSQRQQDDGMTG